MGSLLDRIYGSLLGGAVGDALGAPVEGWNYWEIRERFGTVREFVEGRRKSHPAGTFTDDSALRHYIANSIIRKQGRIRPDDLAAVWLEKGNSDLFWSNERSVYEKLVWGANPWETGRGAMKCATASMAISPVGIINAGNPGQAYHDGYTVAGINQDGEERDGGGAFAAGIAAALIPGATVDTVIDAIVAQSGYLVQRSIELTFYICNECPDVRSFTERYYRELTDWFFPRPPRKLKDMPPGMPLRAKYYSGSSLELIPVALAILKYTQHDPAQCLYESVSFGRDCDSIATMAGCLAGALWGSEWIPPNLSARCQEMNRAFLQKLHGADDTSFLSVAEGLLRALQNERALLADRASDLDRILMS